MLVRFARALADHGAPVDVEDEFLADIALEADKGVRVHAQRVRRRHFQHDQVAARYDGQVAMALDGGGKQALARAGAAQAGKAGTRLQAGVVGQQAAAFDGQLFAGQRHDGDLGRILRKKHGARAGGLHHLHAFVRHLALERAEDALATEQGFFKFDAARIGDHGAGNRQHFFILQAHFQQAVGIGAETGHARLPKNARAQSHGYPTRYRWLCRRASAFPPERG